MLGSFTPFRPPSLALFPAIARAPSVTILGHIMEPPYSLKTRHKSSIDIWTFGCPEVELRKVALSEKFSSIVRMKLTSLLISREWASEGVGRDAKAPWILKISAKKVVFLVSSRKTNFTTFGPPRSFWKNPLVPPLGTSDAHGHVYESSSHLFLNFSSEVYVCTLLNNTCNNQYRNAFT